MHFLIIVESFYREEEHDVAFLHLSSVGQA